MFDQNLRRYCKSIVREVPIPRPFSASALCRELSVRRSRRIYLHPYPQGFVGSEMPCGLWVKTQAADHIFFESNTSRYHQDHIILHEIGHMLCNHTADDLAAQLNKPAECPQQVLKTVRLGASEQIRGRQRTSYTTRQEREAELVASMILERAMWDGDAATEHERYLADALGFNGR